MHPADIFFVVRQMTMRGDVDGVRLKVGAEMRGVELAIWAWGWDETG